MSDQRPPELTRPPNRAPSPEEVADELWRIHEKKADGDPTKKTPLQVADWLSSVKGDMSELIAFLNKFKENDIPMKDKLELIRDKYNSNIAYPQHSMDYVGSPSLGRVKLADPENYYPFLTGYSDFEKARKVGKVLQPKTTKVSALKR